MVKRTLILFFAFAVTKSLYAQNAGDEDASMKNIAFARDQKIIDEAENGWWKTSMKNHDERIKWWREARFGMFIHWGVYAEAGGEWEGKRVTGYAEHLMRKEKISKADYLKLAAKFNPVKFDADKWVKTAKAAGMGYLIITAKHHDGFAMYPSAFSSFNINKKTPFKRDPMVELSAACKKYGIKFGFYYSHAFDWEHPDAPGNDWEYDNPGGDKLLHGGMNWFDVHPELLPKVQNYLQEKAIPQIKELIKNYHPDIMWFDTPHKIPLSENIKVLKAIRELDQNLVVNGRLAGDLNRNFGDYLTTADRSAEFFPVKGDWEAVPTTNESYGYSKYDRQHKPASHFIKLLANAVSRGGNILMNIGPKGDGTFDVKDQRILDSIAVWMNKYGESIHGTSKTSLPLQSWGVTTQKDTRLFLHVFQWPKDGKLMLGGLRSGFGKAYLLNGKSAVKTSLNAKGETVLQLPTNVHDPVDEVIVMEIQLPVKTDSVRYIADNLPMNRLLAFDAKQTGSGLFYGDGKANKFYVAGWNKISQSLKWTFRTLHPKTYKIVLKYIGEKDNSGDFEIGIAGKKFTERINPSQEKAMPVTLQIGTVDLNVGKHSLNIKPINISGKELMKILEIDLIPNEL